MDLAELPFALQEQLRDYLRIQEQAHQYRRDRPELDAYLTKHGANAFVILASPIRDLQIPNDLKTPAE